MIPHSRPWITDAEAEQVSRIVRSGMLLGGDEAPAFASELCDLLGLGPVILRSSGRVALRDALARLELPAGAGIIVQTYVCEAVVWAIKAAGLEPVFCDIGEGWTSTPETVAAVQNEFCGAVLLAPPFGFLQAADRFRALGLPIVHDLCQAAPSAIASTKPGQLGDMIVLSFDPTKYLCAGGGGAYVDLRPDASDRPAVEQPTPPLGEMQAGIGRAQLQRLGQMERRRHRLAELFDARTARNDRLRTQLDVQAGQLFRYPLEYAEGYDDVAGDFAAHGVTVRRGVDGLAHRGEGYADDAYPNALRAFRNTVSPPFYPALSDDDAQIVARALEAI